VISIFKSSATLASVMRWIAALLYAFVFIPPGLAQAPGPLKPEYAEGLKSMSCGACVELGSVVSPTGTVMSREGGSILIRGFDIRAATESDLTNIIGVAETTRARTAHVCLGESRRVKSVQILPVPEAARTRGAAFLSVHPDAIDGVCIGSLLPIEVFLETVMSDIFARRLKEFDARLSPETVEAMVRNRLADALAKDRALMMEDIKRAVVTELKGQPGTPKTASGVGPIDGNAKVCTSGALSCPGKTPGQCCRCLDHPGIEGTCDAGATPQSWRPKAAKP